MRLDVEKIMERADEIYLEAKLPTIDDLRDVPPAFWPKIKSDQVKAAVQAIVEAINKESTT